MQLDRLVFIVTWLRNITSNWLADLDEENAKCRGIDIRELTIEKVHRLYESQKLTPFYLVECYVKRIEALNPYLNAVIEINYDAYSIADEINMKFRRENIISLPLLGIPILLKDNIGTKDNTNTTAGSWALVDSKPKDDAEVVKLLRKAGAIILGKTNLSEFVGFRSSKTPPGWSGRGNQTKNPYNLRGPTAGSSSGSAVAVAANLCMAALGTETDGSIIGPSSFASIVGMKPTLDDVPIRGVIPFAPSLDSLGPMARTVIDTYKVYKVISMGNTNEVDLITSMEANDYLQKIFDKKPFYKVGVINKTYFQKSMQLQMPHLNAAIARLADSNVEIVYDLKLDLSESVSDLEIMVFEYEFKKNINNYLENEVEYVNNAQPKIKCLSDIINYYKAHPEKDPDGYGQDLLEKADLMDTQYNLTYIKARKLIKSDAQTKIQSLMHSLGLHALVIPSNEPTIPSDPAAVAGFPSINLPAGHSRYGVPYGITLFSLPWHEEILFNLAHRIETSSYPIRFPPNFLT